MILRASLKTRLIKEKADRYGSCKETSRRRAVALQGRLTQQMSCIAVFSQKGFLEIPLMYCCMRKKAESAAVCITDCLHIAPPIIPCQKDESRKEIYQGRKMQECYRISSFSDAEKFSLCRVFDGKV